MNIEFNSLFLVIIMNDPNTKSIMEAFMLRSEERSTFSPVKFSFISGALSVSGHGGIRRSKLKTQLETLKCGPATTFMAKYTACFME